MSNHSYDILPKRGQCLLSYGDDKDKDTRNSENNVLMYTGLGYLVGKVGGKNALLVVFYY